MEAPFREGTATFQHAHFPQPAQTWYRVYGDLTVNTPLVVLHGGPGFCHNYLLPLADLAPTRAVILYGQIGNGRSTHYPEKRGDHAFWTVDLLISELENLLAYLGIAGDFDLLGHSWGGMLGAFRAVDRLRATLPQPVQETLKQCEDEGRLDSTEYADATMVFLSQFSCQVDPWPQELLDSLVWATEKDSTVASTILKDWCVLDRLQAIQVLTLLINGRYDEAQNSTVEPFFWGIPKVKWVTLSESAHCPQFDEPEKYLQVIADFLASS
ncbi:proline-specific peptidase [Aspergillus saccharolyticus JOP 1030-1]|uniref:Proline-specific peptidase n=1 Tax=Aspergillus saccharolyticus JOP 1030-1 TaxID=1450539 RepID=A0A318ZSP3_9EURO|nr:proline-specific peptidase [Aspergillus saccharolyticus JOP 1030-1]PYH43088.1 proline-specific peptidase [Aspergillus saccharolyticus JOP 1030-1]